MGCGTSIPEPTRELTPEPERIVIPFPPPPEPEDPRDIFLAALIRLAKTADPNYPEHKVRQFWTDNEENVEYTDFYAGDYIYREGDNADGVYVVIRGELSVNDVETRAEIMRIFQKDFFFDVECVYSMKCHYTVQAFNPCTVFKLPTIYVEELIKDVRKPHILQWYVRRRYPPNLESLNPKIVYNKICVSVLKQVPLFSLWQDSTIEGFIDYMGSTPMIFFRPNTAIMKEGDSNGDMQILVRGSARFETGNESYTVEEADTPIVVGEEGNMLYRIRRIADCVVQLTD